MNEEDQLRDILDYNKFTGLFTWKISPHRGIIVGQSAGSLDKGTGYTRIQYKRKTYLCHRLAWTYEYNKIPENYLIDHINGQRDDNRIVNLRLCTHAENQKNRKIQSNNVSGYKGVHWNKKRKKWRVQVQVSKDKSFTHYHEKIEQAVEDYRNICKKYHGEFFNDTTLLDKE